MLYRAIFGIVPMILIALFATGAIPLSSVTPAQEYRSSVVAKEDASNAPADAGKRPARTGRGETPSVGEAFRMHAELSRDIAEMERETREERDRLMRAPGPGWEPKSGGWGR
jgi:hypothetical protein